VSWEQVIGLALALLVMSVGVLGSVLPGIPSTPLVLAAAVGHRLYFGPASASNWVLGCLVGLLLLSLVMDYLATTLGARRLGATWRGVLGAVLGAVVGLFFSLPGILLGPFVGAALLERLGGRDWKEASRAGLGAVLGLLLGAVGKLACCVAMMTLFAVSVILNSGAEVPATAAFGRTSPPVLFAFDCPAAFVMFCAPVEQLNYGQTQRE
jgi:hypothetical protein